MPRKQTSLPSVPVCQPMTPIVRPSPDPAYQSMKLDSIRTSPETQAMRPPAVQMVAGARG